jgi:hypothetical protein
MRIAYNILVRILVKGREHLREGYNWEGVIKMDL